MRNSIRCNSRAKAVTLSTATGSAVAGRHSLVANANIKIARSSGHRNGPDICLKGKVTRFGSNSVISSNSYHNSLGYKLIGKRMERQTRKIVALYNYRLSAAPRTINLCRLCSCAPPRRLATLFRRSRRSALRLPVSRPERLLCRSSVSSWLNCGIWALWN